MANILLNKTERTELFHNTFHRLAADAADPGNFCYGFRTIDLKNNVEEIFVAVWIAVRIYMYAVSRAKGLASKSVYRYCVVFDCVNHFQHQILRIEQPAFRDKLRVIVAGVILRIIWAATRLLSHHAR